MADENQVDETTTASEGGSPAPETGKDGQPFDAARAQATIAALRTAENDLKKQLRDGTKKVSDLEARIAAFEDKDKTEVEKATGQAHAAERKLSETEARLRAMSIRVAVAETASAAGIAPENVKAAIRLLDADSLELDDDGEPKNTEAALKALVKEFPMLAAQQAHGDTKPATQRVPSTPRPSSHAETQDDRVKRYEQRLAGSGRYAPL